MSISDFDKTRHNIRAHELSDNDRKAMMQKFIEHGGKVVNERRKQNATFDRQRQLEIRTQLDTHQEKIARRTQGKKPVKKGSVKKANAAGKAGSSGQNPFVRFFDLIRIRFMLFMLGVTNFSATVMKNSFFEQFMTDYKNAIMEIQSVYLRVFKAISSEVSLKIVTTLDRTSPMHFELIEMGAAVYDNEIVSQILDEYIAFREKVFYPADIASPITTLFEKTVHLNNYQEMLFSSYDKAMAMAAKINNEYAAIYPQTKKRLRNSIYVIFNRLFPRLYWLVCLYNSRILPLFDIDEVESIMGMSPDDRPGNRMVNAPGRLEGILAIKTLRDGAIDQEESEKAREELKKKSAPKISEEVKRGLALHSKIDRNSLAKKFLKNPYLLRQYSSDPIIRSFVIFREFDEEYSVLLATNKIKINTSTDWSNTRNSHREKLQTLFNSIRNCDRLYEDYFSAIDILEKVREDKPISEQQYLSYSKRLTELEREKITAGKNVRATLRQFMSDLCDLFGELNQDMENDQKVVANPQDEIEFDFIEGTKKLQNKKIFQAINMIIDFSLAFIHRLSPGGDLYPDQKQKNNLAAKSATTASEQNGEDDGTMLLQNDTLTENDEDAPEDEIKGDFL